MHRNRRWCLLLLSVGLVSLSGASCPHMIRQISPPPPRALPASPTVDQVIQTVNQNNTQIVEFSSTNASLSGSGFPTLRASIAFQRPRRFRLRADSPLGMGPEIDLGSNDDAFWFWMRRAQPPALYFCRHDQFAASRARQAVAMDPNWLIEALGIAELDPSLPHEGPIPLPGDRLELRTIRNTPEGPTTKSTIVDAAQGWIVEQAIYDLQGRLIASAVSTGHRRDPLTNLVMPRSIALNWPSAQLSLRIDLGNIQINRMAGNPAELWTMPAYPGAVPVNLCDPRLQTTGAPLPVPPSYPPTPAGPPRN